MEQVQTSPKVKLVIAYVRVSTDTQDVNAQKLEILEWARTRNIHVNRRWR